MTGLIADPWVVLRQLIEQMPEAHRKELAEYLLRGTIRDVVRGRGHRDYNKALLQMALLAERKHTEALTSIGGLQLISK